MKEKYLAIEIHEEVFVMNNSDELGALIDNNVPHKIIGHVCTEHCDTMCIHYCQGTCPCHLVKDAHGKFIHVFN